ncbi:Tyrosine-protein phosphatase 69D [Amphibalanus amphitrite]|uniref:protein-tyrosine-phosphatase n=1 Tax=Amphibalanus amphitrite TaxID=1232801 RepID=A0A6A4WZL2_AMPAM|nr:Tyrosine-protein phosphatase 69D [Amphibalanus amphitrite]
MDHPIRPWCWLFYTLLLVSLPSFRAGAAITKLTGPELLDECDNATISCTAQPADTELWWTKDDVNVSRSNRITFVRETKDKSVVSHLQLWCVQLSDQGSYTCHVASGEPRTTTLRVRVGPELATSGNGTAQVGGSAAVSCSFRGSPTPTIVWSAGKQPVKNSTSKYTITVRNVSSTEVESQLTVTNVSNKDGGQLTCQASNEAGTAEHTVRIIVQREPEVTITKAVAVGKSHIYVKWTVDDGNSPLTGYRLQFMAVGSNEWLYWPTEVAVNATSAVLSGLEPSRGYQVRLTAENGVGRSETVEVGRDGQLITQDRDLEYKPTISVKAATSESLTLSWSLPPPEVAPHVQSYRLMRVDRLQGEVKETQPLTVLCPVSAGQLKPRQVTLECRLDGERLSSAVLFVSWQPPTNADSSLEGYTVTVTGISEYIGEDGQSRDQMNYGPESRKVTGQALSTEFVVDPNTNYTVRVCVGTSEPVCTGGAVASCQVGGGLPAAQHLQTYNWWRVNHYGRWLLLVQVDRVTERSGPICCYRIVMVRLANGQELEELPQPDEVPLLSYEEVQARGEGAYLADAFGSDFDKTQYVTLGDGQTLETAACGQCQQQPADGGRRRRHGRLPWRRSRREAPTAPPPPPPPHDGPLINDARYTAFVQLVVRREDGGVAVASTNYLSPLTPAPAPQQYQQVLGTVLGVVCALVICMLILLVTLFALKRYGKDVVVSRALRDMLGSVRGQPVSGSTPLPPIARHELVSAYQDRHRDSDLGFRREFDCLPQRLHDRTTYASEAPENYKKNRYPDIRAYDQTRVKLSQIDGVQSTEYINANFVWGYKERKKFICAQGPLEATIDDFWRMVWEHCCELMIMLTNLEEVGRTKCAKYWPEEGETTYGAITVSLAEEKPYSDYIQRVLSISRPRSDGSVETRRITHLHYLVWKDFMAPEYPTGILRFIKRINEMYSLEMGPILVHCSAGVGRTGTLVAIDSLLQQMEEEGEVTIFNTICDLRHQRNYLVQSLKQYIFVYRALMEYAQFGDTEIPAAKLAATYRSLCGKEPERMRTRLEEEFRRLGEVTEERKAFTVGSSDENKEKNRLDYIVPYDVNRVILAPLPTRPLDTYINASFIQGYDISETYIVTQEPLERTRADFWRMVLDLEISSIVMLSEDPATVTAAPVDISAAGDSPDPEQPPSAGAPASSEPYWPALDETVTYDHITVKCMSVKAGPPVAPYTWRTFCVSSVKGNDSVTTSQLHLVGWPP